MNKLTSNRKLLLGLFFGAFLLTACVWPEKNDPFERLPEEEIETIEGTVYPFSVSVSTRATHRLEKDNHLVSFLASDIIRLDDFEGRKVELDGVRRTEKMREIFWVEAIRLQEIPSLEDIEPEEQRFATKSFSFVYPTGWESSQAPNGTVYFTDKNDIARRVFLTFSAKELSSSDTNIETNVVISNLAGTKKIVSSQDSGKERQEILLLSNSGATKYEFVFDSQFEDFEKKQAFFQLLNSFIEGEENVQKAIEADKKEAAEIQRQRLEVLEAQQLIENAGKLNEEEGDVDEESDIETDEAEEEEQVEEDAVEPVKEVVVIPSDGTYTNLIDERAFYYESSHYNFSMNVPYGYWFRNFGPAGSIATIGFAKHEIASQTDVDFNLRIVAGELSTASESLEGDTVKITFPRSDKTYYEITGPASHRDAMKSVESSVKTF